MNIEGVERLNDEGIAIPSAGEIVLFHHPVDEFWWPAMVLQVDDGEDHKDGMRVQLELFRPRSKEYPWSYHGRNYGQWQWRSEMAEAGR